MSYTKTNWVNGTQPFIEASNLNKIEQGIYVSDLKTGELENLTTTQKNNVVDAINEINGKVAGIETLLSAI